MSISSTPFHSPFLLAGEKSPGFFIENLFDYIESRTKFDGLCDELNQDDVRRLTAIPSSDKAKEEGIVQVIPEEQPDGSFVLRPAATPRELLQSAQMASMHKFAKKPAVLHTFSLCEFASTFTILCPSPSCRARVDGARSWRVRVLAKWNESNNPLPKALFCRFCCFRLRCILTSSSSTLQAC